jgi:hypothetical protein
MAKSPKKSNNPVPRTPAKPAAAAPAAPAKVAARTEVRNSPIPKVSAPAKVAAAAAAASAPAPRMVTYEQIAVRAYEIWSSGQGGSDFDNWVRAERELRGA